MFSSLFLLRKETTLLYFSHTNLQHKNPLGALGGWANHVLYLQNTVGERLHPEKQASRRSLPCTVPLHRLSPYSDDESLASHRARHNGALAAPTSGACREGPARPTSLRPSRSVMEIGPRCVLLEKVGLHEETDAPSRGCHGCWGTGQSRDPALREQHRFRKRSVRAGGSCRLRPASPPGSSLPKPRQRALSLGFHGDGKAASTASAATAGD